MCELINGEKCMTLPKKLLRMFFGCFCVCNIQLLLPEEKFLDYDTIFCMGHINGNVSNFYGKKKFLKNLFSEFKSSKYREFFF